jgi:hypothetical protein
MPNREPAPAPQPSEPASQAPSSERRRIKNGFPEHPERGLAEVLHQALLLLERERTAQPQRTNPDDDDEDPTRRLGHDADQNDADQNDVGKLTYE